MDEAFSKPNVGGSPANTSPNTSPKSEESSYATPKKPSPTGSPKGAKSTTGPKKSSPKGAKSSPAGTPKGTRSRPVGSPKGAKCSPAKPSPCDQKPPAGESEAEKQAWAKKGEVSGGGVPAEGEGISRGGVSAAAASAGDEMMVEDIEISEALSKSTPATTTTAATIATSKELSINEVFSTPAAVDQVSIILHAMRIRLYCIR